MRVHSRRIMRSPKRAILTWALCLLFVAASAGASTGGVLCIGADGHTEIETACIPCCDDREGACAAEPSDNRHEEHEDCSECADVPLNEFTRSHVPSVRIDYDAIISQFVLHAVPSARMVCISYHSAPLTMRFMPLAHPAPPLLSCTVLLI